MTHSFTKLAKRSTTIDLPLRNSPSLNNDQSYDSYQSQEELKLTMVNEKAANIRSEIITTVEKPQSQ